MLFAFTFTATAKQLTVGFIYVGPIGDHGWTYRHDIGRQDVQKHFGDKVKTIYLENVKYGPDAERAIRPCINAGKKGGNWLRKKHARTTSPSLLEKPRRTPHTHPCYETCALRCSPLPELPNRQKEWEAILCEFTSGT